MKERVVYLSGEFVPESEAKISIYDRGFTSGDGIYEATRTFGHKLFRLDDHLDRLFNSLDYVRIDCGLSREEMTKICTEVVEKNLPLLGEDDDYTLWHVISRGVRLPGTMTMAGPTVAIFAQPVDFTRYARTYIDGVTLVTPATRRTPPQSLSPKAKITNKMNHNMAVFEAQQVDPDAIPLMLDLDGNITETDTANAFFVSKGRLCTSKSRTVLGGITRLVLFELAAELGIEVVEDDFTPFDMYAAEEAFISGTSGSIVPVSNLNGSQIGDALPGETTLKLMRAFNELLGMDCIAQAIRHLGDNEAKELLSTWEERLG
ncbi:MAG: branched-chain amino acid aminotransferase [Rhodospirillaceae bacterium]|nr:branched-chain amino acid aminotransferase [Rhodospirillaceae bacterium]|tara:strand:- start:11172 stop:12125 length:954 start_codon:yes stop_codon:yes gene_type:complete